MTDSTAAATARLVASLPPTITPHNLSSPRNPTPPWLGLQPYIRATVGLRPHNVPRSTSSLSSLVRIKRLAYGLKSVQSVCYSKRFNIDNSRFARCCQVSTTKKNNNITLKSFLLYLIANKPNLSCGNADGCGNPPPPSPRSEGLQLALRFQLPIFMPLTLINPLKLGEDF